MLFHKKSYYDLFLLHDLWATYKYVQRPFSLVQLGNITERDVGGAVVRTD